MHTTPAPVSRVAHSPIWSIAETPRLGPVRSARDLLRRAKVTEASRAGTGAGSQVRRRGSLCRCGHDSYAHRHHRRGDECALCACPAWSAPGYLRRLFATRYTGRGD